MIAITQRIETEMLDILAQMLAFELLDAARRVRYARRHAARLTETVHAHRFAHAQRQQYAQKARRRFVSMTQQRRRSAIQFTFRHKTSKQI